MLDQNYNQDIINMPQLPEVETMRRYLVKSLLKPKHKRIQSIRLYYPGIIRGIDHKKFIELLINQSFYNVDRYGKYLLLQFNHHTIISHLRMTGNYTFSPNSKPISKHDHVEFVMTDGSQLVYSDTRKFGTMFLVEKGKQFEHPSLAKLGPQVTDQQSFTSQYIMTQSKKKRYSIKQFLLDQERVCGIGNIYADQILHSSYINPQRKVDTISKEECHNIVKNGVKIMNEAIQNKGTTFLSFRFGQEKGQNVENLKVYGKEGQQCQNCNSKIKKIVVGGRGTHYCPYCQK